MNNQSLMRMILECPNFVRDKLLSNKQIELYEFCTGTSDPTSSHLAAEHFSISVQSASSRLAALYKKGYLKRENVGADSGGDEFGYTDALSPKATQ